jgi:NTE family protein
MSCNRLTTLLFAVLAMGVLTSCSSPLLVPAKPHIPAVGDRYHQRDADNNRSSQLLVVLAFSGGGSRAAALSYGVLKKLRDTTITVDGRKRRLLDEVDYISSVSGGSFTSAYFGLYGDRIFKDYEQEFLKENVQAMLIRRILAPWNWPALWTAAYNRSELAARLYDEILFHGKTFADLNQAQTPFIHISAANLTSGIPFTFDQHQFDLLCQDLSSFNVARAVAASAAVPLALSPISLPNYNSTCASRLQPWAEKALEEDNRHSRAYRLALAEQSYLDDVDNHWIHLVDGGVTDNLGMRPLLNLITRKGDAWHAMQSLGHGNVKKVVIIVVNAQTPVSGDIGRQQSPSLSFGLNAAVTTALNAFSFETMDMLDSLMRTWDEEITLQRCWDLARQGKDQAGCFDIRHYIVDISFDEINNPLQQQKLKQIPTSFNLSTQEVDHLIATGEALLQQSADFQRFLHDMRESPRPPAN